MMALIATVFLLLWVLWVPEVVVMLWWGGSGSEVERWTWMREG